MNWTAKEIASVIGGELLGDENACASRMVRDNREITENAAFFAIRGERFDGNAFLEDAFLKGAAVCVGQRPYTPPKGAMIVVENTVEAMGKLANAILKKRGLPTVSVTGSMGKTTTKDMIACALGVRFAVHKTPENYNNEIGLPLTVFGLLDTDEAIVLEMGMNHRGELSRLTHIAPSDVAVITNIGMCHIENLGSREGILSAKLEILEGLKAGGKAVLNGDDPYLWGAREKIDCPVIWFGIENPAADVRGFVREKDLYVNGKKVNMPIAGVHNMYNALCAIAVAKQLGIQEEAAIVGVEAYRPEGNRQNIRTLSSGTRILCDCYNANPDAVKASLSVLAQMEGDRKIAVLGDMFELGDYAKDAHYETGQAAAEAGVSVLLTVGELSRITADGARAAGMENVAEFDNCAEAAEWLEKNLLPTDAVLIKGSHGMHMEQIVTTLAR